MTDTIFPPIAAKINHSSTVHGDIIIDPYAWLRDQDWPSIQNQEIINYLETENEYTASIMFEYAELNNSIFEEIKSRIALDDYTVPYRDGDYEYYTRITNGQQYWVSFRKNIHTGIEEITLDQNQLSDGKEYFALGASAISRDDKLIAYSVDYNGNEHYTILIKNLQTGTMLQDEIPNSIGPIVWNGISDGFFYTSVTQNWRTKEVKFHTLGHHHDYDETIYFEPDIDGQDSTFGVHIRKSADEKLLFIYVESKDIREVYYRQIDPCQQDDEHDIDKLPNKNAGKLHKIVAREQGKIYQVVHHHGYFYALTNDVGPNFRLVRISAEEAKERESMLYDSMDLNAEAYGWKEIIAMSNNEYLNGIFTYDKHIVLASSNTITGLELITVYSVKLNDNKSAGDNTQIHSNSSLKPARNDELVMLKQLAFPDAAYSLSLIYTTFDAKALRYEYSSLRMPYSIFEINFSDLESAEGAAKRPTTESEYGSILKRSFAGGVNPDDYEVKRTYIPSEKEHNVLIPVSIVKRKEQDLKGKDAINSKTEAHPLLLYGYGSYGVAMSPFFRSSIFSLLDRGFTFAIAHIRGGDELGRAWYESAKFMTKKRTFEDFISVANGLVHLGYTKHEHMIIHGGSAGGMLVGACLNISPSICAAAVAEVPFVDVLNTMLDGDLPLTPGEYNEWGNPSDSKEYYEYIKSYSPYDNVKKQSYPPMLVTAGLHDPRVTYWEPAKWVAKLRDMKTDNNNLLLKIEMTHGHRGASGRFDRFKEVSFMYTFMLMSLNMADIIEGGDKNKERAREDLS